MKKILYLVILQLSWSAFAQQTTTLSESFQKAKIEHKKVLLFFSGSDWCAPCIKFKKNFISNTEFQQYAQSNLIVFNADFPRLKKNALSKEQLAENEKLADQYNAKGLFPYVILFDEYGKEIVKWDQLPEMTVSEFISKLK